jgi:hypothetical protein
MEKGERVMHTPLVSMVSTLLLGLAAAAWAQSLPASPYAGLETRSVKALSAQQIEDLKTGRGMALALAAELNQYPGPQHVLGLAAELGLSEAQRSTVQQMIAAMKAEAIPLGERLIAQEAELDRLFATRSVTPERLAAATRAIGETQAALRYAHLKYHLGTPAILTAHQVKRYEELRGYASAGPDVPGKHGRH